jgi:serine/threonine protein phosphatase PrpC
MLDWSGMKASVFTAGKSPERNEDFYGSNETTFVVADGATDQSGRKYDGQTGGEIASRLVVETCLESQLEGSALVELINDKVAGLYHRFGVADLISDPKYRFSCVFVAARLSGHELMVTSLGDVGFRVNSKEVHLEIKQIDIDNAEARARYIAETGDVVGSRAYVVPLVIGRYKHQNNPDHKLGYGVIDGTHTPEKYIRTFVFKLNEVKTLEIFTDGYFAIPEGSTIKDWEEAYQQVEREDPDKWRKYKGTKSHDDRTVMVVGFDE